MKTRVITMTRSFAAVGTSVLALALLSSPAQATPVFWYGNGTTIGGAGTWNTSSNNWSTASNGTGITTYAAVNGGSTTTDTATFQGTAGTGAVVLGSNISVNAISFVTTGYTVSGGGFKITLVGTAPNIGSSATSGIVSAVVDGAANVGLVKGGTGTLTLSGANTYTGSTTINGGTLSISSIGGGTGVSSNLGAGTGSIFMGSGGNNATLLYTGAADSTDRLLSMSVGLSGTGAIIQNDGAGALNFTNTSNLGVTSTGTKAWNFQGSKGGTISGNIVNGSSTTLSVNKAGTGTWALAGANTYNGATAVTAGILNIQNATALGTTAAGTTVSSGATLQIQNNITVGGEALTVSGTGASGSTGALENVSGTNTYGGAISLGANTTVASDAGSLALSGGISGTGTNLTVTGSGSGSISNTIATTTGSVTKSGSGTWTLAGANTFSGGTTISAGTLQVSNLTGSATGTGGVSLGAATLTGTGAVSGTVTTASTSSVITPATTSTIGNLALGGIASSGLTLNMAIDGTGASNSTLTLGSGGFSASGTTLTLNLYDQGTNTLATNTVYTLVTGSGTWTLPTTINATLFGSTYLLDTSYGVNGILFDTNAHTLSFQLATVPEPGTWAMMVGGVVCLLVVQSKRRRSL